MTEHDDSFLLPVGNRHLLAVAVSGNPAGEPVLVLHGGPGSGCSPRLLSLYDPARQRIVAFDQRGAGQSQPAGETRANTTAHLIADIELLRAHLGIARWRVTGGSWGATLALAYAMAYPQAVTGLVLRSSFLPGMGNVRWFFQDLAEHCPAAWQALAAGVEEGERSDLLAALMRRLDSPDPAVARAAALAWARYESAVAEPTAPRLPDLPADELDRLARKYRLQGHYLAAGCFLDEAQCLAGCGTLGGLPVTLIHGRDDQVCPPANAERLHAAIPGSRLVWIDGCGHQAFNPAMVAAWQAALAGAD
ncbi:alpha/beta fold hydrolase [uncultured Zoogloea sp.]|uniref:alpha/beta fold hydrolase n=1 Tax=uncultured Zoogloea sp. TaxID=160237 RepID=UPI002605B6BF|nr:alpha/beta fold hydrolase [uncultured Zoogloea sp.]